jgi:uncharacterized damage-inducible protein DinB
MAGKNAIPLRRKGAPDQAEGKLKMTNREFFLQWWEQEHPTFLRVFKALPVDKSDYRPHEPSMSAAELVWLLAYEVQTGEELIDTGQSNWKETVCGGVTITYSPMGSAPKNLGEMITAYEKAHQELVRRLKELDDKTWEEKKVKFVVDGQVTHEDTLGGAFWLLLFDAIHHRGQLTTYIRPMGGKVPSIYGPSADNPSA